MIAGFSRERVRCSDHQLDDQLLLIGLGRDTHFSDAELAMLQLIQPHLGLAWKSWMRERNLKQKLADLKNSFYSSEEEEQSALIIRRQIANLPIRRREVVELVAAGYDNQQISDELKISILTVKKHMQLIFQTLEVQHRTALAAKWHKGHSIPIS
jgi:ATP/maltotriose-dependent transcriptional regulator MalT